MRIMLVAQDNIYRNGVEVHLARNGWFYETHRDTSHAIDALRDGAGPFDCIIFVSSTSDISSLLGLVNLKSAAENVPLIAHFLDLTPDVRQALIESGISVYVDKQGISQDFLPLDAIRHVSRGQTLLQDALQGGSETKDREKERRGQVMEKTV